MRRLAFGLFAILCIAAAAFAASTMGPWAPIVEPAGVDTAGGPDLYGYTWKDTYEPGGPVYNWKDISTTGTLVTGLGDDNYAGPFPIGFPFHYYWYDITQYWIGSNGYIKFGTAQNIAPTFPASIPLAATPNDFAAIYIADWDAGTPPGACQVYRWNNADSLVISYINLHPWTGPGVIDGAHTFQAIFSRLDSNITFQYGAQSGTVYTNTILIGIESVNGVPGLEHSHGVYRSPNTAAKFYHPATSSYIVHDMAAVASANANSEGFFLLNQHTPYGKVKNVGNQAEATFEVNCTIRQDSPTGPIVYNQTVTGGPLAPSAELEVNFPTTWTPTVITQYLYYINVNLVGDINPANNQKLTEARVMILPGTMMFDDGSNNQAWSWIGGNGGLGMRFVPPSYPVTLDSIRFFIPTASASSHPFVAQVLDDNGPAGMPGDVLFTQNINTPTGSTWYGTTTTLSINSGAVYVAWQMVDSLTAALGTDNTYSLGSRQSYEYTGVWAVYRNAETYDVMIRAKISGAVIPPNVTVTLLPVNPPIIIPPTGGSFDWDITMHNGETTPQTLDVWTIITLPGGSTRPGWGPYLNLNMVAGQTINRIRTQNISDRYPPGAYTYTANIGDHPSVIWDSDSFPWTKAAAGDDGWARNESSVGLTPAEYALRGAIPNPFNPTTTLSFELPQAGSVKLSVYNVTGREVATLVNGWRDAGNHEVTFDATGLASGLYVYQLTAGDFHAIGKMMLLK